MYFEYMPPVIKKYLSLIDEDQGLESNLSSEKRFEKALGKDQNKVL